jgi:hypothetical protein
LQKSQRTYIIKISEDYVVLTAAVLALILVQLAIDTDCGDEMQEQIKQTGYCVYLDDWTLKFPAIETAKP